MSQLTDQKSLLAKLMATENIRIEHKKISTAAFDPTNRVMYLPIWKDMEGTIYDLLTGHEVGHALYTPAEGWHNSISEHGKNYKGFLNVVEDARIEKKVQRRYPGLRYSFKVAYELLFERDFFNIKNRDINEMAFIDRLNIYTKSQYTRNDIIFKENERVFVQRAKNLETWEDVVKLTNDIFEYSKNEKKELPDFDVDFEIDFDEELDCGEGLEKSSEKQEDSKTQNQNSEKALICEKESEDYEGDGSEFNEPFSETDYAFRNNEYKFVDESSKEYEYVSFPTPDLKKIVTPAKIVHAHMNRIFYEKQNLKALSEELFLDFRNHNERYISLLVKEFEMRKAASVYDKRKQSETGDIDISKLSSYKFDDNIFKRLISVPKGKSHGLMLLLDYSGSMRQNLGGSIEQILVLAMFCRKVNIEFGVYAFSNSTQTLTQDYPEKYRDEFIAAKTVSREGFFSRKEGELSLTLVQLREYLNSDMSTAEFKSAVKNMLLLRCCYEGDFRMYQNGTQFYLPLSETLSNTPLTQAVVAMAHILKHFKQRKNLDVVNLAIIHDGDADMTSSYCTKNGTSVLANKLKNCYFVDPKIGFHKKYDNLFDNKVINIALEWLTAFSGADVFGFYIVPSSRYQIDNIMSQKYVQQQNKYSPIQELSSKLAKEKFIISYNRGYQHFYFIVDSNLKIGDDELVVTGEVTQSKLKSAFMKMNKKKQINRILVNKFIQGIAV